MPLAVGKSGITQCQVDSSDIWRRSTTHKSRRVSRDAACGLYGALVCYNRLTCPDVTQYNGAFRQRGRSATIAAFVSLRSGEVEHFSTSGASRRSPVKTNVMHRLLHVSTFHLLKALRVGHQKIECESGNFCKSVGGLQTT